MKLAYVAMVMPRPFCIALQPTSPVAMCLQGCAHRRGDPGKADGLAEQEDHEPGGVPLPGAGQG